MGCRNRSPSGASLKGHTAAVWSVAFSPDGKMLATGSSNGSVILWDVFSRKTLGEPLTGAQWRDHGHRLPT